MEPTKIRSLVVAALVVALLANVLVRAAYGSLPVFPVLAGGSLAVLGLAEALAGNVLRARIRRRPGTRPVQPLVAARAVLVAKASALGGAVMAGVWLGLLAHVLPRRADIAAASGDSAAAGIGLACALGLVGGALWLEHCCRNPDDVRSDQAGRVES